MTKASGGVLFIYKKSAYQLHVRERKNRLIKKLIESDDRTVRNLLQADRDHVETLDEARDAMKHLGVRGVFRYRSDEGLTEGFDLVVGPGCSLGRLLMSTQFGTGRPIPYTTFFVLTITLDLALDIGHGTTFRTDDYSSGLPYDYEQRLIEDSGTGIKAHASWTGS